MSARHPIWYCVRCGRMHRHPVKPSRCHACGHDVLQGVEEKIRRVSREATKSTKSEQEIEA